MIKTSAIVETNPSNTNPEMNSAQQKYQELTLIPLASGC